MLVDEVHLPSMGTKRVLITQFESLSHGTWQHHATSEGQVDLFTNPPQQGSLLLLMHFQHGF
jgi:hypothetical protein